jgi:hypothetical protein
LKSHDCRPVNHQHVVTKNFFGTYHVCRTQLDGLIICLELFTVLHSMLRVLWAGSLYFAAVFSLGFVFGVIRILLLVPRLGEVWSVLIELPVILSLAWIVCDRLTTQLTIPPCWQPRLSMGAIAFVLLMIAEAALSVWLIGNSFAEHLEGYGSLPGIVGLAGQLAFAFFPLLQMRWVLRKSYKANSLSE